MKGDRVQWRWDAGFTHPFPTSPLKGEGLDRPFSTRQNFDSRMS